MVLQEYKPSPVMSQYIRTFRLVHYDYNFGNQPPVKPYPPRPEHCLSFYARDFEIVEYATSAIKTGKMATVLFGHQTEVTNRYVGNNFLLIQVVFKPGVLYRMTGIPSSELTNKYIDAETVFSKEIKFVNDKINDCKSFPEMIQVVEDFLLVEIKRKLLFEHPLDFATADLFVIGPETTIDTLAKNAYLSVRHFERKFLERMGITPKYFLRVMRFENAFRMKNRFPHADWLTIAINCGYYDYQHLVRDYKELTGLSPGRFHEIDQNGPERIFGEADTY